MRIRVPGDSDFSATSVGELKKTIESRSAPSTRAVAAARTLTLTPIKINRRCLRVIRLVQPREPCHMFDAAEFVRIAGERPVWRLL